jgi:hypothetical protein
MGKLSELSDKLVVMSHKAFDFLKEIYAVPEEKIVFIHHGIPDTPFIDPSFNKDKFGVEGKKVLLTFGLLSPNKGIENVLQALPAVIKKHPDVAYIILGATHPHILKQHGDAYRIMLQQLVRKLDIGEHVIFQNRFVELKKLCEFLGIADIYITPYLEEAQITSGTLAYAMGTGKAIISTPYWYATEMLAEGGAELCPSTIRMPWRNKSSTFWTTMSSGTPCAKKPIRSAVTQSGRKSPENISRFSVKCGKTEPATPVPGIPMLKTSRPSRSFELPEIKLDHLKAFTDDTGILQHANYTIPDRTHGYCTDDNARALLVAAMGQRYLPTNGWGLIHSAVIISDFCCMPSMKKMGAFAIS